MRPLIALAGAVLVAGSVAGCSSSGSGQHTATSPPPVTPTSAGTSAVVPPEVPPGTTATTSAVQLLQQWYASVESDFAAIQQDTEAIKAAAAQSNVSALPQLCGKLHDDAVAVSNAPRPPDNRLVVAVASAMTAYGDAASSCLSGNYGATADAINKGGSYLAKANAIIDAVNN